MKNLKLFVALVFSLFVSITLYSQRVGREIDYRYNKKDVRHQPVGTWRYLGSLDANHSLDHDVLRITGRNDYYRKLKFKVTNAPVNIQRMVVRYENGTSEPIPTRLQIPEGGESRIIDLRGDTRRIRSIEFWYDTKGVFRGKAKISVFGRR